MPLVILIFLAMLAVGCNSEPESNADKTKSMVEKNKMVDWAATTNIYEVNIRQYTQEGTFNAFAKHLPRLKEMGVHTIWLMPITPIAQKNKKGSMGSPYACSDYTAINPEFGTFSDFKSMVNRAHAMDMKVIIDWVANHTGWDHVWAQNHPEYYLKDSATGDFKIASGMDDIIELDFSNPALRRAMIEAMQYWVQEADIDGFRCDLASWVELDFWEEAIPQVDSVKKLFWLGEFDELDTPGYLNVFDACYTWNWMHKTKDFYEQKISFSQLDSLLRRYNELGDKGMRAWFTSNHDENSWNGTEYEKYGEMADALAVFSATWNGVPLLYSGQELPNLKRLEFFEKDPIAWTDNLQKATFFKTLLKLKATHPALRGADSSVGTYRFYPSGDTNTMAYVREKENKKVMVLLNFSQKTSIVLLGDKRNAGEWRDAFTNENINTNTHHSLELKPWAYKVFVQ